MSDVSNLEPDHYRPLNPIRGFSPMDFSALSDLRKAIEAKTLISASIDDPAFDETMKDLIAYWSKKFDLCYYLALKVPGMKNIFVYTVITVMAKNPGTSEEQLIARSMMFSMVTSIITKNQLKELAKTFMFYPRTEESFDEPEIPVVAAYDPDELDDIQPPAYIESLADLSKY